jgi:hypothetical protein
VKGPQVAPLQIKVLQHNNKHSLTEDVSKLQELGSWQKLKPNI